MDIYENEGINIKLWNRFLKVFECTIIEMYVLRCFTRAFGTKMTLKEAGKTRIFIQF